MITIYKFGTTLPRVKDLPTDDNSQQQVGLMREDILILNFTVSDPIDFQVGDYCYFFDVQYLINKLPNRTVNAERNISYALTMESLRYDLGKVDYLFMNAAGEFTETSFPLRGRAQDFADLIILNLKREFVGSNWILGNVIVSDYIDLEFKGQNCLQVLGTIADAFKTEYLIEFTKDAQIIHIYQKQLPSSITLEYGQDKPLLSISESDPDQSNIITRLYVEGSTRNLPLNYRGGVSTLRMPVTYLEKNKKLYKTFEFTKYFDGTDDNQEIYPHRTGYVSKVDDSFNFYDDAIDFDVKAYEIPGVTPQITFNTGLLAGYTFNISENGFNYSTKKFTILANTDEKTIAAPSVAYTPAIGDSYVITSIYMPQSYIDKAEAELLAAGQDFLDKNSIPVKAYSVQCNTKYFSDFQPAITICQVVQLVHSLLGINKPIRIIAFTRNINNPNIYGLTLADTITPIPLIVKYLKGL